MLVFPRDEAVGGLSLLLTAKKIEGGSVGVLQHIKLEENNDPSKAVERQPSANHAPSLLARTFDIL